jgi:hypothetical protein
VILTTIEIRCDYPGCFLGIVSREGQHLAMVAARQRGWWVSSAGDCALCEEHTLEIVPELLEEEK